MALEADEARGKTSLFDGFVRDMLFRMSLATGNFGNHVSRHSGEVRLGKEAELLGVLSVTLASVSAGDDSV